MGGLPWDHHNGTNYQLKSRQFSLEKAIFPHCTNCPCCIGPMPLDKWLQCYVCSRCCLSRSWRSGSIFDSSTNNGIKIHEMLGILGVVCYLRHLITMDELVEQFQLPAHVISRTMDKYWEVLVWWRNRLPNLAPNEMEEQAYDYFLATVAPEDRIDEFFIILKDYHGIVCEYNIEVAPRMRKRRGPSVRHSQYQLPPTPPATPQQNPRQQPRLTLSPRQQQRQVTPQRSPGQPLFRVPSE